MHYADFILATQGPLSRIWLAAHWDRKLNKNAIISTDIVQCIQNILSPNINVALKTTGHLLLGVVKIYARKTIYLLSDCNEALVIFSHHPRIIKSTNKLSANTTHLNNGKKKSSQNSSSIIKSNQSRVEDITLQAPNDLLHQVLYFKEFDDNFMNDYDHSLISNTNNIMGIDDEIENVRNDDISYEVARNQSNLLQNDLTNPLDNTDMLMSEPQSLINQTMLSNINIDDFDMENYDNNTTADNLVNSALHNFTLSGNLSENANTYKHRIFSHDNRLEKVFLDPLKESSKSNLNVTRKRRLIIDNVTVICDDNGDNHLLKNFNSYIKTPSSLMVSNSNPQKENIPPKSFIDTSINPFMTIRSTSSSVKPLAKHCTNLLSFNYSTSFTHDTTDHNQIVDQSQNFVDDFDFNDTTTTLHNTNNFDEENNFTNIVRKDNTNQHSVSYDLDKTLDYSLEKYDNDSISWSESTSKMAKNLLSIYKSQNKVINFNKYLKSGSFFDKKTAAQQFYSLLILQRENLFQLQQDKPYYDITVIPSDMLLNAYYVQSMQNNNENSFHSCDK